MIKIASSRKGERRLSLPSKDMMAAIAVTRFGLGARPGEIAAAKADPQGWLIDQIRPRAPTRRRTTAPRRPQRFRQMRDYRQELRPRAPRDGDPTSAAAAVEGRSAACARRSGRLPGPRPAGDQHPGQLPRALGAVLGQPLHGLSHQGDHLVLVGPFEREAIRPYVFDRFENLLVASSTHPAMLTYLDQAQSIGPNSRGRRRPRRPARQPG
jgi:uncharacterized protein (DUF1800 family)